MDTAFYFLSHKQPASPQARILLIANILAVFYPCPLSALCTTFICSVRIPWHQGSISYGITCMCSVLYFVFMYILLICIVCT